MNITNKELDIIGEAYQRGFDERIRLLNYNNKKDNMHQLDLITIADTWINYPSICMLKRKVPNEDFFNMLLALAKDIDLLDDARILASTDRETEALLKIMEAQEELNQKINMSAFAKTLKRENITINVLITSILEMHLRIFDRLVRLINKGEPINISYEGYCRFNYPVYDINFVESSCFKKEEEFL